MGLIYGRPYQMTGPLQPRLDRDILTHTLAGLVTVSLLALIVSNDLVPEIIKLFIPISFIACVGSYYLIKLVFEGFAYISRALINPWP
jgi:hypothetical protein